MFQSRDCKALCQLMAVMYIDPMLEMTPFARASSFGGWPCSHQKDERKVPGLVQE